MNSSTCENCGKQKHHAKILVLNCILSDNAELDGISESKPEDAEYNLFYKCLVDPNLMPNPTAHLVTT
jgi:hypothetical protein